MPPWAIAWAEFDRACNDCGDCIRACPEGILDTDRDARPRVHFERGGCSFCRACVNACGTGALGSAQRTPWAVTFTVSSDCLSASGVHCRVCGDWCDARAISFPQGVERAPARIDSRRCLRCGACVAPCPAAAISAHPLEQSDA